MTPSTTKTVRFLVDLDTLLDTRMGTILKIDLEKSKTVMQSGYFTRDKDVFEGIDPDQFAELYRERNQETLKLSMITPMVGLIKDFANHVYSTNVNTPFVKKPIVRVNIYPYTLDEEEQSLLTAGFSARMDHMLPIEMIRLEPEAITPGYLKQDYTTVAMYQAYDWLDLHAKRFEAGETCPGVMFLAPLLIRAKENGMSSLTELQRTLEMMTQPFVGMQMLPATVFSADVLPKKPTKTA